MKRAPRALSIFHRQCFVLVTDVIPDAASNAPRMIEKKSSANTNLALMIFIKILTRPAA
jgi:hypothetical protein